MRNYFKLNSNKNTLYQHLWTAANAVLLRRKFVMLNAYTRKGKMFKIKDLGFQFKKVEKQEQIKFEVKRKKVINKEQK